MLGRAGDAPPPFLHRDHAARGAGSLRPVLDVLLLDGPESILELLAVDFAVRRAEPTAVAAVGRCVVAVAIALDRPDVRAQLQAMHRRSPTTPLVILTSDDPQNLHHLLGLKAQAVVTIGRTGDDLRSAVTRLQQRDLLDVIATTFEQADTLDDLLRSALAAVFRSMPPMRTAKRLARRLGIPANRLSDVLRDISERTGWHWPDVLHAVALWRMLRLLPAVRTLQNACDHLGLDPRTVRRACRHHLDCTPSELQEHAERLERALLDFAEQALLHRPAAND